MIRANREADMADGGMQKARKWRTRLRGFLGAAALEPKGEQSGWGAVPATIQSPLDMTGALHKL